MDIGSIFLILALFLLTALYIGRPLFERTSPTVNRPDHDLSQLLAERDRVLNALQELDFDHTLGKVPEADYPLQREHLVRRGAEILRQLDERQGSSRDGTSVRLGAVLDNEQEVHLPIDHDDELESLIASRRRARQGEAGGFCPQCGGPVVQSDRFCPKCGSEL